MRLFRSIVIIVLLFTSVDSFSNVPDAWTKSAYAYDAKNQRLRKVLQDFAKTFGVGLSIKGAVKGRVNGKLKAENAQEYLDRLALQFSFQWFVYNHKLYISPRSDQVSASIDVSEDAVADLKEALTQIGLLDKRFGWGELPDEGVVIVSGPSYYVEQIKKLSRKKKKGDDRLELMVFPLRYASATDRTITYRDQDLPIKGVASILKELLGKSGSTKSAASANAETVNSSTMMSTMAALQGMQDQAQARIQSTLAAHRPDSQIAFNKPDQSIVSADIRNNSILIRDLPEKREMYEAIVKSLDVARNVIEIDAVILDIERTKLSQLGINWQVGAGSTETTVNASGVSPFISSGGSATVLIQDFGHFLSEIRALESNGEASLIASPSILTIENLPAVIDFNNTNYISTVGERVANVESVTVGTSLRVTARSITDGDDELIQLDLNIEDGTIENSEKSTTPNVKRSTINTQTVMRTDRSLVVGGFNVTQSQKSTNKIPVLGDIPGIGGLFRYKNNRHSDRERLFIITPRLVGTEANPLKYVSEKNRALLEKTLDKQKKSRDGSPESISRVEVSRVFKAFSDHYIPDNFTAQDDAFDESLTSYCATGRLRVVDDKLQSYKSDRFRVVIGVVKNSTSTSQRFDEALCDQKDMMGVTVMPKALIAPGQEAEVMLAIRLPIKSENMRPELIAK